jgi:hypothetical protein
MQIWHSTMSCECRVCACHFACSIRWDLFFWYMRNISYIVNYKRHLGWYGIEVVQDRKYLLPMNYAYVVCSYRRLL